MEDDYMHMQGLGRGTGTSLNLQVMVDIHMVSVNMIEVVYRFFMSMRLGCFLIL